MDAGDNALPQNSNLKCHECGENKFKEREGFYYCQECGTKQEQVRIIGEDDFIIEPLKKRKLKISVVKAEKPQLTSWECYNYILRGFVEELLSFGAKEELKLMTLQVWAAYLRRREVAFFNRKQPDLPKLGIKYLKNDAETIYNHSAHKKRQRRRSEDSCTSGGESRSTRSWRKSKRKLDESNYSLTSATSGGTGLTTSTSANTNRAINIDFNVKARAFYKKKWQSKHLEKHAADAESVLTCHKQPTAREIKRSDYNLMVMNTKQIYSILAIALNLIGDEIQLSDLVRFIHEGHIGTSNVLQYFPEKIASSGKEMLRKIDFYKFPDKYTDKCLRDHVSLLCKNIGIRKPKDPDILKLVQRYATELCLPKNIIDYIKRLINLLPPQFAVRTIGQYPCFEARAMAYIVFTLKLLYGLDGRKELRMSRAAQKLNSKIKELNHKKGEEEPLLFVWNEWVEYIEMRKVIVSQFNTSFCEQFKQSQSTTQVLEKMSEEMRKTADIENLLNDTTDNAHLKHKLSNFKLLFERFQENVGEKETSKCIEFKHTLTPGLSYLKNILLFCDNEQNTSSSLNLTIPNYMRTDHSQRNINCYLEVKPLIAYFKRHGLKLNVHALAITNNKEYVGIFRSPRPAFVSNFKMQKACFDIDDAEWVEIVKADAAEKIDDLGFLTDLNSYSERHKRRLRKAVTFDPYMNYDLTLIRDEDTNNEEVNNKTPKIQNVNNLSTKNIDDLQSMHSFELFSENNMEPIDNKNFITNPRRNVEHIDLFKSIIDEESLINEDDGEEDAETIPDDILSQELSSLTVNSRQPHLEEFIKAEPVSPNHKKSTEGNQELKMYISKMDCWMMLGTVVILKKPQVAQLQDKLPRSFAWLLETCAQTINADWLVLFEQLLCIEVMFCLGIDDPKTIKNCVYMSSCHSLKEIQSIISCYREIW